MGLQRTQPTNQMSDDDIILARQSLQENIIIALADEQNRDQSEYRWIYEVVVYEEEDGEATAFHYYTEPSDCHWIATHDDDAYDIHYIRVSKTSPTFAMAFHNSNVDRIRRENGMPSHIDT